MSSLACVDACETAVQGRWQSQDPPVYQRVSIRSLLAVFCCALHHQVKKDCRHDTSLAYACLYLEVQASASHAAGELVVEVLDDLDEAQGNPIGSQKVPQTISVDAVSSSYRIHFLDIIDICP